MSEPIVIPEDIPTAHRRSYWFGARAKRQGRKMPKGVSEYYRRGYRDYEVEQPATMKKKGW